MTADSVPSTKMGPIKPVAIASPEAAETGLRRLVAICLADAGFQDSQPEALDHMEVATLTLLSGLAHLARGLCAASRRTIPSARDALAACEDQGLEVDDLKDVVMTNVKRDKEQLAVLTQRLDRTTSPIEVKVPVLPIIRGEPEIPIERLDIQPLHLPPLPPLHSYKSTSVFPSRPGTRGHASAFEQLRDRTESARLVEASLRHLVSATPPQARPTGPVRNPSQPRLTITFGKTREGTEQTSVVNWENSKDYLGKRKFETKDDFRKVKFRWKI